MKVIKYTIEDSAGEPRCIECGNKILVGEVSYEYEPKKNEKITLDVLRKVWCKKCLPKGTKIIKGTQLND